MGVLYTMSSNSPDTRSRILAETVRLLKTDRSRVVRISDIAKAAGISRQALYLHFSGRGELLVAATLYLDEIFDVDKRLERSRNANSGTERLDAFIDAWCGYMPDVSGVARALVAMKDSDEEARAAWQNRMTAVRQGCEAAVAALDDAGVLNPEWSPRQATDLLWTLLSIENRERLVGDADWSQKRYVNAMRRIARDMLVRTQA